LLERRDDVVDRARKNQPSDAATPLHASAPMASKRRKRASDVRIAPAMPVATAANPGTNLANISDGAPSVRKMRSVWRTQLSGDKERRHISRSTRRPKRRPAKEPDQISHQAGGHGDADHVQQAEITARAERANHRSARGRQAPQADLQRQHIGEDQPQAVLPIRSAAVASPAISVNEVD